MAVYVGDRYLNSQDGDFVHLVSSDLERFLDSAEEKTDRWVFRSWIQKLVNACECEVVNGFVFQSRAAYLCWFNYETIKVKYK